MDGASGVPVALMLVDDNKNCDIGGLGNRIVHTDISHFWSAHMRLPEAFSCCTLDFFATLRFSWILLTAAAGVYRKRTYNSLVWMRRADLFMDLTACRCFISKHGCCCNHFIGLMFTLNYAGAFIVYMFGHYCWHIGFHWTATHTGSNGCAFQIAFAGRDRLSWQYFEIRLLVHLSS